ncbi:YggS family pyridoxal phosphate-dependent enzyme [Mangrovibacillus cuniculi]|uniref:Pyridoxal phosphate homeostasis protein n=1 Tax=Mangrovibacillus cuniculi TaxID=2593652 RepID=A0A7S8CA78_9BACI|nr:YggS family pyridoxal phosphate-dependent enzyme [Mangrovibacillus cuniculi]QPC46269.1 YggS family pyridoxal phosphate-dependent enzyme [Mangrovibacillus cuniculi]
MQVKDKKAVIDKRILEACTRANRDRKDIHVIAVTKYVSNERTLEAVQAGIQHLGENRIEGLLAKQNVLKEEKQLEWHFIGTLQSRKVKEVIGSVDYIHSLDRISIAKEIEKRSFHTVNCFVQVNVSSEESKHGLSPTEIIPFIEKLREFPKVKVIGLMTMAPNTNDESTLRECFKQLREIRDTIIEMEFSHAPCKELSMGMSNDFEIAIEEGATYIRIGTSLVGEEE